MNYDNNYSRDDFIDNAYEIGTGFSFSAMFITAIIIIAIILGIWFYYAVQYRYSSGRIAEKLRKKYKKDVLDTQTLLPYDGRFTDNTHSYASALMTIQNKDIEGSGTTSQLFTLPVKECSPIDYSCVEL